jgi:tricorn protease
MTYVNARLSRTAICTMLYIVACALPTNSQNKASARSGYYRFPAIHGDTVIFTAEGDLWSISTKGGEARRLTSNPGEESLATISPDGKTVAFSAEYEGPTDVYTMPIDGGLAKNLGRRRIARGMDSRRSRARANGPLLHSAGHQARRD